MVRVDAPEEPVPWFRTGTFSVKGCPTMRLSSSAVGASATRSAVKATVEVGVAVAGEGTETVTSGSAALSVPVRLAGSSSHP